MIQELKDAEVTLTDSSDFRCGKLRMKIFFSTFLHLEGLDTDAKVEGEFWKKE